jgi:hypothetical protein
MKLPAILIPTLALMASLTTPAFADSPARERELTCSDGTVFIGEQVRMGGGRPPHIWHSVTPGADPVAFNFHASSVTAPDGTVVENVTWDNTQGVERHHELVTCSFIIPIGPFTDHRADFVGFFVPAGPNG